MPCHRVRTHSGPIPEPLETLVGRTVAVDQATELITVFVTDRTMC